MLGLTARSAATLVVSQSIIGCAPNDAAAPDTAGTGNTSCVLTAALTEGPFFVDERLNRSDIRADPATGAASAGVPLSLSFRVSRSSAGACTPLTGAFLDVWHCDAAGAYSDVGGTLGRRFLRGYQVTDAARHGRVHDHLSGLVLRSRRPRALQAPPLRRRDSNV